MNKKEYLHRLDELNFDKDKYCIIAGGVLLFHGLKNKTDDIDIKILPEYFEKLKGVYPFKKSNKYSYLWQLYDDIELAVLDFNPSDIDFIDKYPVEKLEKELE